jgi:hypothetical protein
MGLSTVKLLLPPFTSSAPPPPGTIAKADDDALNGEDADRDLEPCTVFLVDAFLDPSRPPARPAKLVPVVFRSEMVPRVCCVSCLLLAVIGVGWCYAVSVVRLDQCCWNGLLLRV